MKRSIIILLLLMSFLSSHSQVYNYVPFHLRCSSYPLNAGVVYAFSEFEFAGKLNNDSWWEIFDTYVSDEEFKHTIDLKMIVMTYAGYCAKVIPVDSGYTFLGFTRATFLRDDIKYWDYWDEEKDYFYPDVKESDFSFDPEMADVSDERMCYWDTPASHACGFIGEEYFNRCEEEGYFPIVGWKHTWTGPSEIFPENPNEYVYAVFTRVMVSNERKNEIIIYPRANEIGDEVTLTCTRDDFDYWIEEGTGRHIAENPYTFTVTGKETYTAHFGDPSKMAPLQLPRGGENGSSSSDAHHSSSVYDLQGRKVNVNDKKGIYIKNGRKQVIR